MELKNIQKPKVDSLYKMPNQFCQAQHKLNENGGQPGATPTKPTAPASAPSDASLNELKSQLEAMQAQLNSLAGGKSDK